jgi:antitoxin PrlF
MIKSKITDKAQTTIPQPVRSEHVLLTKTEREPIDDPFASFREWWSEVDRRAFGDL